MNKKNSNVLNKVNLFKNDKKFLNTYSLFKKNINLSKKKKYLVAVSGGSDSLALSILSKIYEEETKVKNYYVLVDHGIRKNSSTEALLVKKLLLKFNIKLTILKNSKDIKNNVQSKAREIRYGLLVKFCKKQKINYILTAHHSDDQIETFLIRLSRGSGIQGLSSMKLLYKIGKNIKILRPLLDSKKKDLIYISRHIFGKIFQDPSNKNEKYLRTKIRKLIKLFEKSGIKHEQIIKSINNLGDTSNTLNLFLEKIYKDNVKKNRNKTVLDFQNLKKETSETRLKVLSRAIKESSKAYYPPRSKKVLNLIRQLSLNGQKKLTLGGCLITKKGQYIEIKKLA